MLSQEQNDLAVMTSSGYQDIEMEVVYIHLIKQPIDHLQQRHENMALIMKLNTNHKSNILNIMFCVECSGLG